MFPVLLNPSSRREATVGNASAFFCQLVIFQERSNIGSTLEGVNMATPQHPNMEHSSDPIQFGYIDLDDQDSGKTKVGLTPGTAEGDRETVEESLRIHELKGDL
jgi:hypothetical protein